MKRAILNLSVYWLTAGGIMVLVLLWAARTSQGAISDCIDATCRITTADGGRGSGCVFEITAGRIYVLTAAHVADSADAVQCEFWSGGHQSTPLPGRVIMRSAAADAAVVLLEAGQFAGRLPKAVPLAAHAWLAKPGDTLTSVGCANGAWSTGWKGHALGYQGGDLHFLPTPANGRSGSALFDAEGAKIVGIVRARDEQSGDGIATSVQSLYQGFQTRTQCGPGGCNPGGGGVPQRPGYLLPYRNWQAERDRQRDVQPYAQPQPPQQVWPTLPLTPIPESPRPQAAPPDFGPITQRLDQMANNENRIIELLMELRRAPAPISPAVPEAATPQAAPIDEKAAKAAEDAKARAEEAREVAAKAQKDTSTLAEKHDKLADLIRQHGTLFERFEARREAVEAKLGEHATRLEKVHEFVKSYVDDKIANGGLLELVKFLGLPLGLVVVAWLITRDVRHKVETGDPLMIEKAFHAAQAMRDSILHGHLLQTLHGKVGDLAEKVGAVVEGKAAPTPPPPPAAKPQAAPPAPAAQ